jgi:uncharacterized protein YbjT (DUF2867 family)
MKLAIAGGTGLVGRYVVEGAERAGHEVVVLSRSRGVDLVEGSGMDGALEGVDVVVDVTNAGTTEQDPATAFFKAVAANLQHAAAGQGVRHVITLSIVGIDRINAGYYGAKLEHERVALAGDVPATILRATQFHEFPGQMIGWTRSDGVARLPNPRVQTVAARTVADQLVELAQGEPRGMARDLAGPEQAELVALARTFAQRRELDVEVQIDENGGIPDGALLPDEGALIAGPTFEQWLDREDARSLRV